MLSKLRIGILCLCLCGLLAGCGPSATPPTSEAPATPAPPAEWRGVWVSYLDLQTLLTGTTPATAAAALDRMMDTVVSTGLNTVLFHVRSHSDAWYQSRIFPAATQAAPLLAQGFDPLAYAVEAAHQRGLALHAWLNPYRIGESLTAAVVTEENGRFQKDGVWYYNPAHPAVHTAVLDGVREILDRYAVDGIHLDDYFYPAGMAAEGEAFEAVPAGMSVAAYRRTQVNTLVAAVYGLTHRREGCTFGISPAGDPAACAAGYADVATWLILPGYIDYLCPQVYFGFEHQTKDFGTLLNTWAALSRREGVRLHIGLALYKTGLADDPYAGTGRGEWANRNDILSRQIDALRQGGYDGFGLYRYRWLESTDTTVAAELEGIRNRCNTS